MALQALKWLALAATAALIALILYAGEPGALWWWPIAIPFAPWAIGPAIVPWLAARYFAGERAFTLAMLGFLLVSSIWSGILYYDAFFVSTGSTAALVLIFFPLYQWLGLGIVTLLARIAIGLAGRGKPIR